MSCPHHGDDACCTKCPGHKATDGRGFPHSSEAKGRTRMQFCPHCGKLADVAHWMHLPKGPKEKRDPSGMSAWFGCLRCWLKHSGVTST